MKILAIDPGFERIGIAILEKQNSKEHLLYSSCFKTSSGKPFATRLNMIGVEITRLTKEWKPDGLAIETLFFNTNQKTVMRVAEARGVIIYAATSLGLSLHEYTPLQVKIAVTGYGRATKTEVERMVDKLIEVKKTVTSDDEMDAIAIGLTALASISPRYPHKG
ncbi:MAG: crossover junction endodeoxyribonuclease RuvC [Patescibacteria group bacterium]|nr:crossover junction endodeoxyribonuclease RuvC [Patescibacteria group bacterium]